MKRAVAAVAMTGVALLGLCLEAQAQSLIMPCGPLSLKEAGTQLVLEVPQEYLSKDYFYPALVP